MEFRSTKDSFSKNTNTLVLGNPGVGKTTQCANYQKRFGNGILISMESGDKSLGHLDMQVVDVKSYQEFVQVQHWINGTGELLYPDPNDPNNTLKAPPFKELEFKWICLDSITELSQRIHNHANATKKGIQIWGEYKNLMLNALKFFRDIPMHTLVIALATKSKDVATGEVSIIPMTEGGSVSEQICGIFDNVIGIDVYTALDKDGKQTQKRRLICSNYLGWTTCKVRDPSGKCSYCIDNYSDVAGVIQGIQKYASEMAKSA